MAYRTGCSFFVRNESSIGPDGFPSASFPAVEASFPFTALIPSWNVDLPAGASVSVYASVRIAEGGMWTPYYSFGTWSSDDGARRSAGGQSNEFGNVSVDTLSLNRPADAFRLRFDFAGAPPGSSGSHPPIFLAGGTYSAGTLAADRASEAGAEAVGSSDFSSTDVRSEPAIVPGGIELPGVPSISQYGFAEGKGWCSPTCLAMAASYWRSRVGNAPADPTGLVPAIARGVYDQEYGGCGNWSFNAAYAGSLGFSAAVVRFSSLDAVEALIGAGIPVAASISWDGEKGRPLAGAPLPRSSGHLTLIVGFDGSGDPIMREPAAPDAASVRRSYHRAQFQLRWLEASGGAVYIIRPRDFPLPDGVFSS